MRTEAEIKERIRELQKKIEKEKAERAGNKPLLKRIADNINTTNNEKEIKTLKWVLNEQI